MKAIVEYEALTLVGSIGDRLNLPPHHPLCGLE